MAPNSTEIVGVDDLRRLAECYLMRIGVAADAAQLVARILVDADMRGHPGHGVALLPLYATRIHAGGIDPDARPTCDALSEVSFRIDAHGGPGQLAMWKAAEVAARQAAAHGISYVTIGSNNHIGMLAAYRHPFVEHDVVGLIFNISGPSVAPPHGSRATIGNNALCCIVPSDDHTAPFIVDLATGTVACGKIRTAEARGEEIPAGWLLDRHGKTTLDPAALDAGGAVPVFGGYKGLAVSIIIEVMAGLLGGHTVSPLVSRQRHAPELVMGCSQFVLGVRRPHELRGCDVTELLQVLSRAVSESYSHEQPEFSFPEQRERSSFDFSARHGVPISRTVLADLRDDLNSPS